MAELIINSIMTQRTDTKQNWELKNPVLLKGEIGIEIDTGNLKVGDGVTKWLELISINTQNIPNEEIDEIINEIIK